MRVLFFIIGLIIGGMFGVALMCLLQAHRLYKHDMEDRK